MNIAYNQIVDEVYALATVHNDEPLSVLACAIESGVLWSFAHVQFKLTIRRSRNEMGMFVVRISSDLPVDTVATCQYSACTKVDGLLGIGKFSKTLTHPFDITDPESWTLVQLVGLKADEIRLADLSYWVADVAVDLFKRGSKIVRWQGSAERCQMLGDVGLSSDQLKNFADMSVPDYTENETIASIKG